MKHTLSSNKLAEAVRQRHRRSSSKQKLGKKDEIDDTPLNNIQKQIQIVYSSQKVQKLRSQFIKQVVQPIGLYTAIQKSNQPQKCLLHNNISTLYCLNDQRILCAGCMYQSSGHKGHKVVPFNRVFDQMKLDVKTEAGIVQSNIRLTKKALDKTQAIIQKAQKEYPLLMEQIHQFYMGLHQLLIDKKAEQLKHVSEVWSKLRYENYHLKIELTKISDFAKGRLRQIQNRNTIDEIIFNKNVLNHLTRIEGIVDNTEVILQQNHYFKQLKKFSQVYQFVDENLRLQELQTKTIQSVYQSAKKKSNKPSPRPTPKNMNTENQKQREKTIEQRLIEAQLGDTPFKQRKLLRNRHSKTELRVRTDLSDRKSAYQKQKMKKQRQILLNKSQIKPTKTLQKNSSPSPRSTHRSKSILKKQ